MPRTSGWLQSLPGTADCLLSHLLLLPRLRGCSPLFMLLVLYMHGGILSSLPSLLAPLHKLPLWSLACTQGPVRRGRSQCNYGGGPCACGLHPGPVGLPPAQRLPKDSGHAARGQLNHSLPWLLWFLFSLCHACSEGGVPLCLNMVDHVGPFAPQPHSHAGCGCLPCHHRLRGASLPPTPTWRSGRCELTFTGTVLQTHHGKELPASAHMLAPPGPRGMETCKDTPSLSW